MMPAWSLRLSLPVVVPLKQADMSSSESGAVSRGPDLLPDAAVDKPCSSTSEPHWHLENMINSSQILLLVPHLQNKGSNTYCNKLLTV